MLMSSQPYKPDQDADTNWQAAEPFAPYQTSLYNAQQRACSDRDVAKDLSFEERYALAKEFAYSHFGTEYAQELERHHFYIDRPFPTDACQTEEDWMRMVQEAEQSGVASEEEVANLFAVWGS